MSADAVLATRAVTGYARDADDLRLLLDILGLTDLETAGIIRHGTFRAYIAGCRCDECRAKNAAEKRKHRRRAASDPTHADRAGHGKANTYKNHSCRCDACKRAHADWQKKYFARKRGAA